MEVLLSTHDFAWIGGTQTYAVTVAEHLEQLGHDVTIYGLELGEMAEAARRRGLRVVGSQRELPEAVDVVYAQEGITPLELGGRYPETPCVVALQSRENSLWLPPQLPGTIAALVVLSDGVRARAASYPNTPKVVRLRQPVDTVRFSPRGPLRRARPRVLLLGNYVSGERRRLVFQACDELGYEYRQVGYKSDVVSFEPEAMLNDVDIVVGKARVIVEAMACGRAAFVYDQDGGDGWVTPEKYPELEADNFGGRVSGEIYDLDRLREELAEYRPELGPPNRDLAVRNHNATRHAEALVGLFERLAPRASPPGTPLAELARLMRLQWQATARATTLAGEAQTTRERLEELAAEHEALHGELIRSRQALEEAERQAREAWEREQELRGTRRYRLAGALAAPLDAARSLAWRNGGGSG